MFTKAIIRKTCKELGIEVINMVGRLLRDILPDKIRNRKAEACYTCIGLK